MCEVLTIRQAVARARREGLPLSEYTLRLWVNKGTIPSRNAGNKKLVYYPNIVRYLRCDSGSDSTIGLE